MNAERRPGAGAAIEQAGQPEASIPAAAQTFAATGSVLQGVPGLFMRGREGRYAVVIRPVGGEFRTLDIVDAAEVPRIVGSVGAGCDVWVSAQPTAASSGRGRKNDVSALVCLYGDLDMKANGLESLEVCDAVIDELSIMVGSRPAFVVETGHGLQPYWLLDPWILSDQNDRCEAQALLRRWGRLVQRVARAYGGSADNVFDLARVLRAPGTVNVGKGDPVPTRLRPDTGRPLTVDQVGEALGEYAVPTSPGDHLSPGAQVHPAPTLTDFPAVAVNCTYGAAAVRGLLGEPLDSGRHPWLVRAVTRVVELGCAGCVDARDALDRVARRFQAAVAQDVAERGRDDVGEVNDAISWALDRAGSEVEACTHGRNDDTSTLLSPSTRDESPRHRSALREGALKSVPVGRLMAADALKGRFLFATGYGWHRWDGRRWQLLDSEDEMVTAAADWVEGWITRMLSDGEPSTTIKEALKYREIGNVVSLVRAARTAPGIVVAGRELDAHPWLLNAVNGVVDLRTAELKPHDPDLLMTKLAGAKYVPGATHPDWVKALEALPDVETAAWFQRQMGSAATGLPDRTGPVTFHQGDGANGKTSVIGAVRAAFGDYAVLVPDKLMTGGGNEHDTMWMPLHGARLAYLEELPEDHVLPVARIKKLAETPEITARHIGQNYVSWSPTHTLVVSTNYHPTVNETDHGTWRRLAMICYPHTFRGADADPTFRQRLKDEAQQEAVLAWIVDGARAWLDGGQRLTPLPAAMTQATDEWRGTGDLLAQFLNDHVEFTGSPDDGVPTTHLHERFLDTLPRGSREWSQKTFSERLKAHYLVKDRALGVNRGPRNRQPTSLWGVRLKPGFADGGAGCAGWDR